MSETLAPASPPLSLFAPPYKELEPFPLTLPPDGEPLSLGSALIWQLSEGGWGQVFRAVRARAGGVALVMILPPADRLESVPALLEASEQCRPHSVLPHHGRPAPEDLRAVLRRPPEDLPMEFTDYLAWRGIQVDMDTRRLVRRTVELSSELRTVTGLARALYMSRRALGRRFLKRGLPVPSHILHFARLLRASIALQTTSAPLFEIACDLGYPDGFALSNQMLRLTGLRPTTVRRLLGWEWIVEAWLRTEAGEGKVQLPDRGEAAMLASPHPRPGRAAEPRPEAPTWRSAEARRRGRTP